MSTVIDATAMDWRRGVDQSACPVCQREGCEDPSHVLPEPSALRFATAANVIDGVPPVEIVEGIA